MVGMARRGRYPAEGRERAVRMVFEHAREYESQWAAIVSISGKLGMTNETLRKWVRQAEIEAGARRLRGRDGGRLIVCRLARDGRLRRLVHGRVERDHDGGDHQREAAGQH